MLHGLLHDPRYLLVTVVGVSLSACSMQAPGLADLGAGASESFRVTYSVRCRECRVFYTTGEDGESVDVEGSWSKTVRIRNSVLGFVRLSASPTGGTGYVERAYIDVDGKKVAEERRDSSGGFDSNVSLSAPLTKSR